MLKLAVASFLGLSIGLIAAPAVPRVTLPTAGFAIDSLEAGDVAAPTQALSMMLPPTDAFAPNVNVLIQPYAGTLDEYADLSRKQFTQVGATIVLESPKSHTIEYAAEVQGKRLHFYAKFVRAADQKHIYLATATATEVQWPPLSARMKACVDSLDLATPPKTR